MSFQLYARMAQFPLKHLERVDEPGGTVDDLPLDNAASLATVHWIVQSDLGLPIAPFEIDLCARPVSLGEHNTAKIAEISLDKTTKFELSLLPELRQLNCNDALCVSAALQASPGTEIYATDVAGNEIPETRQNAEALQGTAFIGPGILGLRATGDVAIKNATVIAIHANADLHFQRVATVAPVFDGVQPYAIQSYDGLVLPAREALSLRVAMDAVARANTASPSSSVLDIEIHREKPDAAIARVLTSEIVLQTIANFIDIARDPSWSYALQIEPEVEGRICPVKMLQMLCFSDSVTATTLGQSVTIPLPPPFEALISLQTIYEVVEEKGILPFPIVRVSGYHAPPGLGQVKTVQLAGLVVGGATPLTTLAVAAPRPPQGPDKPATCDVRLSLDRRSSGLTTFIDLSAGADQFLLDERKRPKHVLAGTSPDDQTDTGHPSFTLGPFDLPFISTETTVWTIHCRDVFGRWLRPSQPTCELTPWPVQAPRWGTIEVDYASMGTLNLRADIAWDWSLRSPYEIRVGLAFSNSEEEAQPEQGVKLPDTQAVPLIIRFNGDEPELDGDLPAGWSVFQLPDFASDHPAPPAVDYRRYRLNIGLGSANPIFRENSRSNIQVCADAWENVSGKTPERRSPIVRANSSIADPRPPQLSGSLWRLEWASRADGDGRCHAFIDPTGLADRPVAGFFVWRAHESALCDLGLKETFADEVAANNYLSALRAERDQAVRLAMIQSLIDPHLHRPVFRRAFVDLFEVDKNIMLKGPGQVSVAGVQSGLEFVMLTAMSLTNVPSDKLDLPDLRAIAVPNERVRRRADLRLLRPTPGSAYARSGLVVAAIGSGVAFPSEDVRIFWDSQPGLETSDELLHRLKPLSEISRDKIDTYVAGARASLERLSQVFWRCFILRPPPSWSLHQFAVDLCSPDPRTPAEGIASPRSEIQFVQLIPPTGPTLSLVADKAEAGKRSLKIVTSSVFETTAPEMAPCLIQVDLLDQPSDLPMRAPVPFREFVESGLILQNGAAEIRLTGTPASNVIAVMVTGSTDGFLRIAASDPAGRVDVLTVELGPL